ncbi:hypothetical protein [Ensifer canadensis]|uniref:hypothetical protein n=1 Tax=Ensifer canadensis TaxID=555315 RepID=UPI0035E3CDFD
MPENEFESDGKSFPSHVVHLIVGIACCLEADTVLKRGLQRGVRMRFQFNHEAAKARWGANFTHFASLEEFFGADLSLGVQAINIGKATLFLYYRPRASRNLVVHFSGAMVRAPDRHLPYLAGLDLTSDLDCAFLAIDDPSLQYADDLALGWHIGTKDFSLKEILPGVIQHVAALTASDNIILTGGSGGGFASLLYGSLIPSTVVAFNPQTNIARYSPDAYKKYASVSFGWDGTGDPSAVFGPHFVTNLVEHFGSNKPPKGVYLQNKSDWHTNVHAMPMISALGGTAAPVDQTLGGLSFAFGNWGEGHAPLPKVAYRKLLIEAIHGTDLMSVATKLCAELAPDPV